MVPSRARGGVLNLGESVGHPWDIPHIQPPPGGTRPRPMVHTPRPSRVTTNALCW